MRQNVCQRDLSRGEAERAAGVNRKLAESAREVLSGKEYGESALGHGCLERPSAGLGLCRQGRYLIMESALLAALDRGNRGTDKVGELADLPRLLEEANVAFAFAS